MTETEVRRPPGISSRHPGGNDPVGPSELSQFGPVSVIPELQYYVLGRVTRGYLYFRWCIRMSVLCNCNLICSDVIIFSKHSIWGLVVFPYGDGCRELLPSPYISLSTSLTI